MLAGEPLVNADESAPLRPDSPALYSSTKAQAERLVRDAAREGFETVVLRPRFVWGAGDTTLLPEIVAATKAGRFAWVGGGNHRTSITHVRNVAEGLLLAAERGRPGEAYFVTDGEPVVFREFISEMLRAVGVEPPDRSIPTAVAAAIARGGEIAWRLLPLPGEPPLTRFALWAASQECTIDDSKARRELGYEEIVSREQGMAELAAALAANVTVRVAIWPRRNDRAARSPDASAPPTWGPSAAGPWSWTPPGACSSTTATAGLRWRALRGRRV